MNGLLLAAGVLACIGLAGFLLRWALGPQPPLSEEELGEGEQQEAEHW